MRTLIVILAVVAAAVVAFVLGGTRHGTSPDLEALALENENLRTQLQAVSRERDELAPALDEVQEARVALEQELDRLQRQLASMSEQTEAPQIAEADTESDADVAAAPDEDQSPRELSREDRRRQWEEMQSSPEWQARREEFRTRMRESVSNFVTEELAKAKDTGTQQRLVALEDYGNYMMDLFQQMRDTEDEDERARLGEEMRNTRDAMQTLVREQQDQLLRDAAEELGIRGTDRQDAFISQVRETMDSPFFRSSENIFRQGRGDWGRGGWSGGPPGGGGNQGGGSQ